MLKKLTQYCYELLGRRSTDLYDATPTFATEMPRPAGYNLATTISTIGTVIFDKKRRFFGIQTDGGTKYMPFNLHAYPGYHQHGLRVRFTAELHPGVAAMNQWGTVVRLITLHRVPV